MVVIYSISNREWGVREFHYNSSYSSAWKHLAWKQYGYHFLYSLAYAVHLVFVSPCQYHYLMKIDLQEVPGLSA